MNDTKIIIYLIWGVGVVVLFGTVLARVLIKHHLYPTRRNRAELLTAFGLFMTSLAAFLAITLVFFGPAGTGIRGFFTALALGAFFGVGIVMVSDRSSVR